MFTPLKQWWVTTETWSLQVCGSNLNAVFDRLQNPEESPERAERYVASSVNWRVWASYRVTKQVRSLICSLSSTKPSTERLWIVLPLSGLWTLDRHC